MNSYYTGLPTQDLSLYQGDDYSGVVLVLKADGSDADLTGYSARAQIREDVADAASEVIAEIATTIQDNTVLLAIAKEVTALLCGRYVWDLELTSETGGVTTIAKGNVIVGQEVTRPAAMRAGAWR